MKQIDFLIGLPASGKTTYAKNKQLDNPKIIVLSSDRIREELNINAYTQADNDIVFNTLHKKLFDIIKNRDSFYIIYDATNLSKKRFAILEKIRATEPSVQIRYIFFATTIEKCIERDAHRQAKVGKEVIYRMVKSYTGFYEDLRRELFDEMVVVRDDNDNSDNLIGYLLRADKFKQDNAHHTQTLFGHINQVAKYIQKHVHNKFNRELLLEAALWHDVGKLYTKNYYNDKGERTKNAHFYAHDKVSSYLYAIRSFDTISRINLVPSRLCHVQPYYIQALIEKHMGEINTKKNTVLDKYFQWYDFNFQPNLAIFQKADKYRTTIQKIIIKIQRYFKND